MRTKELHNSEQQQEVERHIALRGDDRQRNQLTDDHADIKSYFKYATNTNCRLFASQAITSGDADNYGNSTIYCLSDYFKVC
jgi:hypothetical protein